MDKQKIKFIQINLNKSHLALDELNNKFLNEDLNIGIIQEPPTKKNKKTGIFSIPNNQNYNICYHSNSDTRPRTCIILKKNIDYIVLNQFLNSDFVAISMDISIEKIEHKLVICSSYHAIDLKTVPDFMEKLVRFCRKNNRHLIYGCDANAYHNFWGSKISNKRGEEMFEFMSANNLEIINKGDTPTYQTSKELQPNTLTLIESHIDLTIATPFISEKIIEWKVNTETTNSDHNYITFNLQNLQYELRKFRSPKNTDFQKYVENLEKEMENYKAPQIKNRKELDEAVQLLTDTIIKAYHLSNHLIEYRTNRNVKWRTKKLDLMKKEVNKARNKKHKTNKGLQIFKKKLSDYNNEIKKAKLKTWKKDTKEIDSISATSRLHRLLASGHENKIGSLVMDNANTFTTNEKEILEILAKTHFPESEITAQNNVDNYNDQDEIDIDTFKAKIIESRKLFTTSTIKWAMNDFKPFKAAGLDEIFPALIQQGIDLLLIPIRRIFIHSYALGYIPILWKEIKVTFIPKAGRRPSEQPKSYRPISLSSCLLKTMEKIIDRNMRDTVLKESPITKDQFAYQPGISTETALFNLTHRISNTMDNKEVCLGAFLDIMGAFDNTLFESIQESLLKKGVKTLTVKWIKNMLKSRAVTMNLGKEKITAKVKKGCPQGGVLSPLLWTLVVDDLIIELNKIPGVYAQGYADDIVILCSSDSRGVNKNRSKTEMAAEIMQKALKIVEIWTSNHNLEINPSKTNLIMFTKIREKMENFKKCKLYNQELEYSTSTKYLGVILDRRLSWNEHINKQIEKATNSLWISKKIVGKLWGLKPKLTKWIYTAMVRPIISYASIIWWRKTEQAETQRKLESLQRLANVNILGANSSTPSKAMELLVGIPPLHLFIQNEAMASTCRILTSSREDHKQLIDSKLIDKFKPNSELMQALEQSDIIDREFDFDLPYETEFPTREEWKNLLCIDTEDKIHWYSDGSQTKDGTGSGIYCNKTNEEILIPLEKKNSVFQAEVHAIQRCAKYIVQQEFVNKQIVICSDSMAAIKSINAYSTTSKVVKEAKTELKKLCNDNNVNIRWIPAHEGYEGNERADECAKLATSLKGHEPKITTIKTKKGLCIRRILEKEIIGTPMSKIKHILKHDLFEKASNNWHSTGKMAHSRKFIIDYNPKRTKELLSLNRKKTSLITDMLTGHGKVKYMQKKRGFIDDDWCRYCEGSEETAEHLLCDCEALILERKFFMDLENPIEPIDYFNVSLKKLYYFSKKLKLSD